MKYAIRNIFLKTFILLNLTFSAILCSEEPKAVLESSDKVDFGTYPANEKKEASFSIKNPGNASLIIKNIRKTCGCANISADRMEIPAGETASIKVIMEPEGIYGAYSKNAYIETNASSQKFIALSFSGDATPAFTIKPQNKINLGRIKADSEISQEFLLDAAGPDYLPGKPLLQSEIKAEALLVKEGNSYKLSVKLLTGPYKGPFKCIVNIPVLKPEAWKSLEIIIAGKIGHELAVSPGKIHIYSINSLKEITASFQIKILGPEKIDSREISFKSADGIEAVIETISGNTATCKLKIKTLEKLQFPLSLEISYQETPPYILTLEKPSFSISR